MLYVPNYTNNNCAYVYDSNFIRVYDTTPSYNTTIHYREYNYNAHYLYREGNTTFNNYSTLPTCRNDITTNYFQRNDIAEIIFLFLAFVGVTWFFISKLVKTLLKGGRVS